jgi:hypothetical protein
VLAVWQRRASNQAILLQGTDEMTQSDYDARVPECARPSMADVPIPSSWDHADLQRIWLGTQSRAWRTLAVVPVGEGISSYEVASLITTLGLHQGEPVGLADLRDVRLNRVGAFLDLVTELVSRGERVVFATRSITENLATIRLARAADAVILCVSIGSTSIGSAAETIEQIGKERFLGSMLIHPHDGARAAPPPTSALKRLQAWS